MQVVDREQHAAGDHVATPEDPSNAREEQPPEDQFLGHRSQEANRHDQAEAEPVAGEGGREPVGSDGLGEVAAVAAADVVEDAPGLGVWAAVTILMSLRARSPAGSAAVNSSAHHQTERDREQALRARQLGVSSSGSGCGADRHSTGSG